jgi:DNA mismatch endonuclease, patch repair protein
MRDPEITSRIMAAVRSRDTRPEVALRSLLWRRGLRFRIRSKLTGKPDIVFPSARLAVFVDGDFWHGNAWRTRGLPSFEAQFEKINNAAFWRAKIEGNMTRDLHVNAELSGAGWQVYRVFESRLKDEPGLVVDEIEHLVRSRQATRRTACVTNTASSPKIVTDR